MPARYDAIVIGAGQAGPPLAERLGKAGFRTVIIERHHVGGTCVNTGCIPTKTLVASAAVAWQARRAADFGVCIRGEIDVDMARVKARKDEVALASRNGVTKWIEGMDNVHLMRGHAHLTGPDSVEVAGTSLQADRIFINVGARARVPDFPGLDDVACLTNSSMMEVDFLPKHLLVVGGSYVGLEFAQMYRRFGSRVTVIEMNDRLVSREDKDVSAAIREILEGEGVEVRTGAECLRFESTSTGLRMQVDCHADPTPVEGTHALIAVGRSPNTDDLGLAEAGVEADEQGYILVDEQLRTSVPGIWALGEVNRRGAFTHTSYDDFQIVAANLLDDGERSVGDRIACYALYTDPPLGRVGLTEAELRESDRRILKATLPMSRVGRAREFGETRGFMKLLVDADTHRILGASILGLHGDEAVHCVMDLMYAGASCTTLARAVHIHPTVSELLPTLAQGLEPLH